MVLRSYCDDEENDMAFNVPCRRRKALDMGRKEEDAVLVVNLEVMDSSCRG